MRISALFLIAGAIFAVSFAGQLGTTGGLGGTTPTAGNGGQTGAQPTPGLGSRGGDVSRPIYISGKVLIEDGSAPPENVTIERVCSGISKVVAYTNEKGDFNFQWGNLNLIVADASDAGSGPTGTANSGGFGGSQSTGGTNVLATDPFGSRMMNCGLRANAAGFTSSTINLFNRRPGDNPDIGVLILRRIGGVEGVSISVTSMMASKSAKKAYQDGLRTALKGNYADAARDFEKAIAAYPRYANAWASLGKMRIAQGAIEPARTAFLKAIECDPKLVQPYVELGLLAAKDAKWEEASKYLDRAVELDPVDFPQVWYTDAVANYNLKRYEAAEKSARAAVKLDPRHSNPRSGYLLGLVLAEKRDYVGAVEQLNTYLNLAPNAPDVSDAKVQLGEFEKLRSAGEK
jgi:TolA-binding protein